jgi:hypothetical protein
MKPEAFEKIICLTEAALAEKDVDRLIGLLNERWQGLHLIGDGKTRLEADELNAWLDKEKALLARLMEEKKKVLIEMDTLAKSRRAVQGYRPKFPIPPLPVFFDIKT